MSSNNKPKTNRKPGAQDIMQTPPHALEPLYSFLPKEWTYWESACGPERLIVETMLDRKYDIFGTDITIDERFDYFTYTPKALYDCEITNVPFSLKYKWLERAFERGKRFAFIVPYETTFAAEYKKLHRKYNMNPYTIQKLSPERRINYKTPNYGWGREEWDEKKQKMVLRGGSAQMPTCWLTYGLDIPDYAFESMTTFFIPMRSVKYDESNQPIENKEGKKKK